MIRVYKHNEAPNSLLRHISWTEEDVINRLQADQHGKCYLCERIRFTDFQVEHLKSRSNFPALAYEWSNLFWSCSYCNAKKLASFDNILNPAQQNVEELIHQSFDFPNTKAIFSTTAESTEQSTATIKILERLFNGTNRIRTIREQRFYEYAMSKITSFQNMVTDWLNDSSKENEHAIIEELSVTSEFLGFKYWIIKSNEHLLMTFGKYIIWNKG
ncbi:MAG: TIGR02646 family protein [Muribaculaceae bacterium]|nr:TIGR02646 family protein [Muribaculaceae bacterium]